MLETFDGDSRWLRYALKYPNKRKIRSVDVHGAWQIRKHVTVEQQLRQALT